MEKVLIKSAPRAAFGKVPTLQKGSDLHQIFSNDKYILKLSSSLKTLYRLRVHREGNSYMVDEKAVFVKLPYGDPQISNLRQLESIHQKGHIQPINGTYYDIYSLCLAHDGKRFIQGFRLIPKISEMSGTSSAPMVLYYIYIRKV